MSSALLIDDYLRPLAVAVAANEEAQRIFTRAPLCDYQDRIRPGNSKNGGPNSIVTALLKQDQVCLRSVREELLPGLSAFSSGNTAATLRATRGI
jgi:hypothetical protein